ncbi:unnamed protein product [Closterium sp. NIES-65]|nr:unnamed protein product [Closterium sp. NIES-65]
MKSTGVAQSVKCTWRALARSLQCTRRVISAAAVAGGGGTLRSVRVAPGVLGFDLRWFNPSFPPPSLTCRLCRCI